MEIKNTNRTISQGLAFDDVLLKPGFSDFLREDIDLTARFTKRLSIQIPLVSSPMDTVTDGRFALALARLGGIGVIHRNLKIPDQVTEVRMVKDAGFPVAAAVGVREGYWERIQALVDAGIDAVCFDAAHGFTHQMIAAITRTKKEHPTLQIIAGSVATFEGAQALVNAGADAIRVGMGPGAICTTRIISGMGVPQFTAILDTVRAAKKHNIPVIADGGIKYSGDMVKALAAGASTVMMGGFFAGVDEAPGEMVELSAEQVPSRFKSVFSAQNGSTYRFKKYRGMGSIGAMEEGARVSSEDEFHGKSFKDKVLVAEGVESLVPYKGALKDVVDQAVGGIYSGMFYVGVKSIPAIQKDAQFYHITTASLTESHPHDVLITDPGKNYW